MEKKKGMEKICSRCEKKFIKTGKYEQICPKCKKEALERRDKRLKSLYKK